MFIALLSRREHSGCVLAAVSIFVMPFSLAQSAA
jgi:hypothetical protein